MATTVFMDQTLCPELPIGGGNLAPLTASALQVATGMTDTIMVQKTNKFRREYPRYGEEDEDGDAVPRRLPKLHPKKVMEKSIRINTVRVRYGIAKQMRAVMRQAEDQIYRLGKGEHRNFSRNEARKFMIGYNVDAQSNNAHVRNGVFNGERTKIRHDPA